MANTSERSTRAGSDTAVAGEGAPAGLESNPEGTTPIDDLTSGAREVAGTVRSVAGDVASQLPSVAATTRDAWDQAARQMETSSTEMLMAGTTLSLGLALGLLIGGANRLLVALALLPAAAMGATLLDRQSRPTGGQGKPGSR